MRLLTPVLTSGVGVKATLSRFMVLTKLSPNPLLCGLQTGAVNGLAPIADAKVLV